VPAKSALRVLVVGTGFGGIGMGVALKQAGFRNLTIVSKAGGIGGVWWDNRYPGAACDVPSSLYSFSFEPNFDWSRSHGTHDEIRRYLEHCVRKYGLTPHLRFNTEIVEARFDDAASVWRVLTSDGQTLEAEVLVSACGLFNRPIVPEFAGRESFTGASFHTARWDAGFDPAGKRIAVVGTGCSAAQIIPAIVDRTEHITLFQRTPAYVNPASHTFYDAAQRRRYRWFPFWRRRERAKLWSTMEAGYRSRVDEQVRREKEADFRRFLESQVSDPEKRRKLTPAYEVGCKRNINSDTYLRSLDRPNVDIVTTPIERITPNGIRTTDGALHAVDTIVYATGFSPANYLSTLNVVGTGGRALTETWQDGPEAYLGMTVTGFPNFFMIYGPNTNAPTSIVFMIECQTRYITDAIRGLVKRGKRHIDPRPEVQARFNAELQATMQRTVWASGCRSYGMTATGKIVTQWPNPSALYRARTRTIDWSDFSLR
jgi:cation diffusion facilitator CzcD-associated flavoprotein CzcO